MAETPLTDSIEALTTYANQVTGASDTNLSDAVYTLAQGYGESDLLQTITLTENSYRITYNIPDDTFTKYKAIIMAVYIAGGSTIDWFYGYFNNLNDGSPYIGVSVADNRLGIGSAMLVELDNGWAVKLAYNTGDVKQPQETGNYMGVRCYAEGSYFAAGSIAFVIGVKK